MTDTANPADSNILIGGQSNLVILKELSNAERDLVIASSRVDFWPWQFERLLNTAADLLDRANDDRTSLLSLLASDFNQKIQFQETQLAIEQDKERLKLGADANREPVAFAALAAKRASMVDEKKNEIIKSFNDQIAVMGRVSRTHAAPEPLDLQASGDMYAAQAARDQFQLATGLSNREKDAFQEELARSIAAANQTITHHERRVAQATNGGPLDFMHEAEIVQKRMLRDLKESLARLYAAQLGLAEILCLDQMGANIDKGIALDVLPNAQDRVRELILWHAKKTQFDQGFTVVFRLRHYCTDLEWEAFWSGSAFTLNFKPEIFSGWWLPRLRGICASYSGTEMQSIALQLRPPLVAERSDGHKINQARVPPCYLGRVCNSLSARDPELNGAVTLINVCPIAAEGNSWEIALKTPNFGEQRIDDIIIEFNCVGIPIAQANPWATDTQLATES